MLGPSSCVWYPSAMSESDTFNKLRRIPVEEMESLIDINNFKTLHPPIQQWGDIVYDIGKHWNRELELHRWRMQLLEENGWTFDEFFKEIEKSNIRKLVAQFNESLLVPPGLMERIKIFFPDAKLLPARLELE